MRSLHGARTLSDTVGHTVVPSKPPGACAEPTTAQGPHAFDPLRGPTGWVTVDFQFKPT